MTGEAATNASHAGGQPARDPADGRILFLDDEEDIRISTRQAFDLDGLELECFDAAEKILAEIRPGFSGVIITDIRMPGMDGIELLGKVLETDPDLPVILVTGHGDIQLAVEAMRRGAYDFIEKPFTTAHLIAVSRKALEKRALTLELRRLRSGAHGIDVLEATLPGRSEIMRETRKQIRAAAQAGMDLLIVGETGTGKDITARAIHRLSERAEKPFVSINCGAIPADHFESELFGHEVGAFPGALRARYGRLEHARGGTVFLDEVESMPFELQIKFLQVLQDRSIRRLGSNETIELDVRFIAASKVDLAKEVGGGRFRQDLLFRLNAVTIRLPELALRPGDIPLLFSGFVQEAANRHQVEPPTAAPMLLTDLSSRAWPGNVRELKNAAERFALGLDLFGGERADSSHETPGSTLAEHMSEHERKLIASSLAAHGGSLKPVYEALGISRKSLYEKMQRHGLSREDYLDKQ
ncbi:MAG: sigma-54-dependent Fis family transcriptional regulator [Nitratireductor sp.]|nr:sigma-54-dependent Fis family transcriptional regulator [Nitratireductor sp.]